MHHSLAPNLIDITLRPSPLALRKLTLVSRVHSRALVLRVHGELPIPTLSPRTRCASARTFIYVLLVISAGPTVD
ncbi:hypothetical protein B0H17DRAFT_1222958 [Mycena rosella]|uniref:Uncharacterized protein n=1 Tax=Mycena rosella TaxID=1033263 RepID=A0AAD7F5C9_MYCRO|nr:hypothetical protein B0H17DRAFT_1222958 [Mycena rosella]